MSAWLRAHPGVEVVSRDRSPTYAAGINEGAAGALQVADRFHLLMNVREAVEKVVRRQNRFLRTQTLAAPPSSAPAPENDAYAGCRLRLLPHLEGARRGGSSKPAPRLRLPSARRAAWLLLRPDDLTDEEKPAAESLCRLSPEAARSQELALSFIEIIKERRADDLRGWLIEAGRSGVAEFITFANGITSDFQAVRAALEYEWSNGQVEGQVHRLKLVKRQMYGRGKHDLPRARVLRAVFSPGRSTASEMGKRLIAPPRKTAAQDKAQALDTLAREELGINPEDLGGSAWAAAAAAFCLFALGAVIPVSPFIFLAGSAAGILCAVVSVLALFLIGAAITLLTGRNALYSGARQVLLGLLAAGITFGLGRLIGTSIGG